MPRVYKPDPHSRSYKKYDQTQIKHAGEEYVMNPNSSLGNIAKKYGMNKSVLYRHSKKVMNRHGGQTVLSDDTEMHFVKYINECTERGVVLASLDLRKLVKKYLDDEGITEKRFKNNLPGPDFVAGFLKRHKDHIVQRRSPKKPRAAVGDTMSDEEQVITETQVLTADFKDGQLEIVEVTPYDNNEAGGGETHILPDVSPEGSEDTEQKDQEEYQILDPSKGLLQLDLLSLTLVKCGDGEESYRLVTSQEAADGEMGESVTCVLQSSDGEEDGQNAYVGKKQIYLTSENQDQYVMVQGEDGPVVVLKSALEQGTSKNQGKHKKLSAVELLEKAKAVQKAKALATSGRRGRKRRGALPPPHELLSSPNFKLFLYSCKLCNFKCNAIKELTAHKTAEHGEGAGKSRGGARASTTTLQCARCPFRGGTHSQLMKHVQEHHLMDSGNTEVYLNSAEAEAADVLVCGACGFESASRPVFRKHIENKHNAS